MTVSAPDNPSYSGLISISTGGTAARFASDLIDASSIEIDPHGVFGHEMFAAAKQHLTENQYSLWRIHPDGSSSQFAQVELDPSGINCLVLGAEGALYAPEYNPEYRIAIISRISPLQPSHTGSLDR